MQAQQKTMLINKITLSAGVNREGDIAPCFRYSPKE